MKSPFKTIKQAFVSIDLNGKILGVRKTALLEITIFLVASLLIDFYFLQENRFWNINPHPFWIIILLITIQYGSSEGFVSVFMSTAALLVWNLPKQGIDTGRYEYLLTIIIWPLLWSVSVLVLGGIADRQIKRAETLDKENTGNKKKFDSIATAYKELKKNKEQMEVQMAGQLRSSIDSFQALKNIDNLNPIQILRGMGIIIDNIMTPKSYSVYIRTPNGFEIITQKGWKKPDSYERWIKTDSDLFTALLAQKRILSTINPKDEDILFEHGILVGPLIAPNTGVIFGLVKIEEMDFMDLSYSSVETFKVLCEWVGASFNQARQFQKANVDTLHNQRTNLLSARFFEFFTAYNKFIVENGGRPTIVIHVRLVNHEEFSHDDKARLAKIFKSACKKHLSSTILISETKRNNCQFAFFIPPLNKTEQLVNQVNDLPGYFLKEQHSLLLKAKYQFHKRQLIDGNPG